jgi:hypothetical protein
MAFYNPWHPGNPGSTLVDGVWCTKPFMDGKLMACTTPDIQSTPTALNTWRNQSEAERKARMVCPHKKHPFGIGDVNQPTQGEWDSGWWHCPGNPNDPSNAQEMAAACIAAGSDFLDELANIGDTGFVMDDSQKRSAQDRITKTCNAQFLCTALHCPDYSKKDIDKAQNFWKDQILGDGHVQAEIENANRICDEASRGDAERRTCKQNNLQRLFNDLFGSDKTADSTITQEELLQDAKDFQAPLEPLYWNQTDANLIGPIPLNFNFADLLCKPEKNECAAPLHKPWTFPAHELFRHEEVQSADVLTPPVRPTTPSWWELLWVEFTNAIEFDLMLTPTALEYIFVGGIPVGYISYINNSPRFIVIYAGVTLFGNWFIWTVRKTVCSIAKKIDSIPLELPIFVIGAGITLASTLSAFTTFGLAGLDFALITLAIGAVATGGAVAIAFFGSHWPFNFWSEYTDFGKDLYQFVDRILNFGGKPNTNCG